MEATNYYITTLTNAFTKIGPIVFFIVAGYFIFVKLPFLFFLKSMKKSKEMLQEENRVKEESQHAAYSIQDYERFIHRKKKLESLPHVASKGSQHEKIKSKSKAGPNKEKNKSEQSKEFLKKKPSGNHTAESIFEIKPGESYSKEELRKKYHKLIKMNHPDKVSALSPEFKKLADKKTKEINSAYSKLLKRAG
jgi:hypothetical protein